MEQPVLALEARVAGIGITEIEPSIVGHRLEPGALQHASIVMWYSDWQEGAPSLQQLRSVAQRGSTPEITWEPWDSSKPLYAPQPSFRLRNIIDGKFDPYIRSWARTLAAWGRPVRLRFAQEMNGSWYPWSENANGNHPRGIRSRLAARAQHLRGRGSDQRQVGLESSVGRIARVLPRHALRERRGPHLPERRQGRVPPGMEKLSPRSAATRSTSCTHWLRSCRSSSPRSPAPKPAAARPPGSTACSPTSPTTAR